MMIDINEQRGEQSHWVKYRTSVDNKMSLDIKNTIPEKQIFCPRDIASTGN